MLGNITQARDIYIACGYTDMRKSIDGLAAIVQQQFQLDPFARDLFLFCGRKRDRIKALLWEGDGFVLSERTRNLLEEDGQLNLFNEIELEGDPKKKEKDPIQLSRISAGNF